MNRLSIPTEEGGQLQFRRCAIADTIRIDVVDHTLLRGPADSLATAYVTPATLRRLADELERASS